MPQKNFKLDKNEMKRKRAPQKKRQSKTVSELTYYLIKDVALMVESYLTSAPKKYLGKIFIHRKS